MIGLLVNSSGKLSNFGFNVFDDSEAVQKVLSDKPSCSELRSVWMWKRRLKLPGKQTGEIMACRDLEALEWGWVLEWMALRKGGLVQKPRFGMGRAVVPREWIVLHWTSLSSTNPRSFRMVNFFNHPMVSCSMILVTYKLLKFVQ